MIKNRLTSLKKLPKHDKPREKMQLLGASNLTIAELLAIILQTGTKKQSVLEVAHSLSSQYLLDELISLTLEELVANTGIGFSKASTLLSCFEIAKRYKQQLALIALNKPSKIFYQAFGIKDSKQEICQAFYVNGSQQLLKKKTVAVGSFNQNFLEFRELLEPAFCLPAAGFFLVHNHPSGNCEPSQQDIEVTKQVAQGSHLVGIELIDHIIVTSNQYYSFKERGIAM
jgi:DNA repair protein RadC